jgi:threonylcarbamoyladenosine tRNA methylthiotransferase MtaB
LFGTAPLCRHLHLSIQSGAKSVLAAMHRHHDIAGLESWLHQAVDLFSDFAFGGDFIAGFPNEDQAAFQATFDFVKRLPLSYLHVFPYSPRPGTAAYAMGDLVGPAEKRRRVRELRDLSREKSLVFRRRFIDHEMTATYEGRGNVHFGLTANYIRVQLDRSPSEALFRLRITDATAEATRGAVL